MSDFPYELIKDNVKWRVYRITRGYGAGKETKAHRFPCIGGPKDGQSLTSIDLLMEGLHDEYGEYNRAFTHGNHPRQVFVHVSKLSC